MTTMRTRRRVSLSAPPAKLETPKEVRKLRSWSYYIIFAIVILPLQLFIMSSFLYTAQRLYHLYNNSVPYCRYLFMDIYAPLEQVIFYVYLTILNKRIQPISLPPPHFTPSFAKQLFIRILGDFRAVNTRRVTEWSEDTSQGAYAAPALRREDRRSSWDVDMLESQIPALEYNDAKARDFREKVSTWFGHAEWHDLCHDDMLTWLSWSLLGLPLSEANLPFLESCVHLVEKRTGSCLPMKRPEGAQPPTIIRLTIDPVRTRARPILLYIIIHIADMLTKFFLIWRYDCKIWIIEGENPQSGPLEYIVRIPDKKSEDKVKPVTLMHGLGFGLPHYGQIFKFLANKFPNRPIVMPLNRATSMMIFTRRYLLPVTRQEASQGLAEVLDRLNASDTDIVSHSFGTIAHTHILKDAPHLVNKSVFLDPVTFCLWEGDLCYRFLYKVPKTGIELLMNYFIATETGLANTLQRSFSWSCNLLWPQEMKIESTKVFIGSEDFIYDSKRVHEYLLRHGLRDGVALHYMDGFNHGECLITRNGVIDTVCEFLE
ncbi:hypothetical protein E3Q13_01814 [Wallemia mellicola]|nr:hypothetical protein E3Q13_01814 [Wallemia mellicola]